MKEEINRCIETVKTEDPSINRRRVSGASLPEGWKSIPLRKIVKKVSETNRGNTIKEVFSNSAQNGIVSQQEYFEKEIANEENTENYTVVRPNDFVYNPRISSAAPYGPINMNKQNRVGIVSPLYTVFRQINEGEVSAEYLECYLASSQWHRYVYSVSNQGARHDRMNITDDEFFNMPIEYPPLPNQKRIIEILSSCSETIKLYKQKAEQLQLLKKILLEKMFPEKDENTPEIRFTGFTSNWEQHKLGEIASSFEYGLNAAAKEYDGVNKYLRITDIDDSSHAFKNDDLTSPDVDLSAADGYRLHNGDILFARTGASVGKTFIYRESDSLVYFAGFLIRAKIKPEFDAEFVYQNTLGPQYQKYIKITSQRSGQPGINAQEYSEYSLLVPSYTEQRKIGGLLHLIDSLITLHQRIVALQGQKKKALIQLLLKGIVNIK